MMRQFAKKIPILPRAYRFGADFFSGVQQRISAYIFYHFPKNRESLLINDKSHAGLDGRGLFSILRETLDIIAANSTCNIYIDYRHTLYNDSSKENMWEYYFEPVCNDLKRVYDTSFLKVRAYMDTKDAEKENHLRLFHSVLRDRIKVKKEISDKVENFRSEFFNGKKIIGVHFRGTDIERAVSFRPGAIKKAGVESYFAEIDRLLERGFEKIFLATDDQKVFEAFQNKYGEKLLSYAKHRSSSKLALHFYHGERYGKHEADFGKREIGEEVLIDVILLSKTDYFIYGGSNVPIFVRYFNPNLMAKNLDTPKNNSMTRKNISDRIVNKIRFYSANIVNTLRPRKIYRTFLYHIGFYKAMKTQVPGLNLGAGSITIGDFWNLDSRFPFKDTDIVAGVEKIKLADNSVEVVYCAHIFEHLDRTKKIQNLKEWFRILKPGGTLYIAVPDLEILSTMYLKAIKNYSSDESKAIADRAMRIIHGGQSFPEDKHFYGYSFVTLENFLKQAGFKQIERFDTTKIPFERNKDDDSTTTLNGILISLNVKATK